MFCDLVTLSHPPAHQSFQSQSEPFTVVVRAPLEALSAKAAERRRRLEVTGSSLARSWLAFHGTAPLCKELFAQKAMLGPAKACCIHNQYANEPLTGSP